RADSTLSPAQRASGMSGVPEDGSQSRTGAATIELGGVSQVASVPSARNPNTRLGTGASQLHRGRIGIVHQRAPHAATHTRPASSHVPRGVRGKIRMDILLMGP